ncbi:MAG: hypothetical protein WCL14_13280 [Bacteroidota bacterium]
MKYIICLTFFVFSHNVNSQTYFISGGAGYGVNGLDYNVYEDEIGYKIAGFGSFGYYLTNKFTLEFCVNIFSNKYLKNGPFQDFSGSFQIIRIMPAVKYKLSKSFYSFYLKGGPSFGFGGNRLSDYYVYNDLPPFDITHLKVNYSGGISPGYLVAFGKDFRLNEEVNNPIFNFYIEYVFIQNFWKPKNITILESCGNPTIDYHPSYMFFTEGIQVGLKYNF